MNAACWLYEVDADAKALSLLVKFRTDFAADESSQVRMTYFRALLRCLLQP